MSILSSSQGKIPGLDHLRALAITLVFLFHYRLFAHPDWINMFSTFGWTGVDLFFVLSGYLIANQIFKASKRGTFTLRVFFTKRFFRILPAYWVVLALYFAVPVFREWEHLPPLWKYLTFTQNFMLDRTLGRTFSHAWSLCIEEQFYLVLPLVVMGIIYFNARKLGPYLLLAFFLAGFALRFMSWSGPITPSIGTPGFATAWFKWMYYPTYNRLDGLLAGIAIAGIFCYYPKLQAYLEQNKNKALLAGLLLLACAYFLCLDFDSFAASVYGYPLIAVAYGCITISAVCKKSWLNRISTVITSRIATLSYALYLVHKAAIHIAQDYIGPLGIAKNGSLMFFVSVLLSLCGALLLHLTVEKPFHRLRDKLLRKPFFTTILNDGPAQNIAQINPVTVI